MSEHQPNKPHLRATLILACLAQFMVILDVSVVNVALPSIKTALDFKEDDLQWVVNAYTVTFAGFLLLGGRGADLLGRRRVFVCGLVLFSLASLAGGLADSRTVLLLARLAQGLGGAVIGPASLSLITTTFTETADRHRAIGIWGAMGGAGGAAGVLLGGIITQLLGWRWIFFVNVPIGLCAAFAAQRLLLEGRNENASRNFDLAGAISATTGLSLLIFGIVRTDSSGWGDATTLAAIAAGIALLILFAAIEGWLAKAPLMPLRLFRSRQLSVANVIMITVGASSFPMWFFGTLYLQDVKGFSPLMTGVAFLPMTSCLVIASPIASKLMARVGPKRLLVTGMLVAMLGLVLFTRITVDGSFWTEFLPAGIIACIGVPFAFVTGMICATTGVAPEQAGLASGVVNTARLFGGALGLAALATIATSYSTHLLKHPTSQVHTANQALVSGFQLAFWIAAGIALVGALLAMFAMPERKAAMAAAQAPAVPAVEV